MINFLVTPHPKARLATASQLFAANEYVVHALEKSGDLSRYERVSVATPSRTTRGAFLRDHEFVDRKCRQYLPLLSRRLNEVHGTTFSQGFWQKAFALSLLRHVTLCFDMFQTCEAHLRPGEHHCRILSQPSFHIPGNFNEHRRFFQHSDYGQEQLFSVYCSLFHTGAFEEWTDTHEWPTAGTVASPPRNGGHSWRERLSPRRIVRRALRLRNPTVGVLNSYFSQENMDRLLVESRGRIQVISIPAISASPRAVNWQKRDALSRNENDFDRFDRFAFAALRNGMPRAFVEDAAYLISAYEEFFSRYPALRWIVSEAWIGDMHSAMALAVLRNRAVRHLCNEHNYIAYPFLGNHLKYIIPLTDVFMTLGWKSPENPGALPGASLFKWTDALPLPGGSDILYIASLAQVRAPEVNASYGESGPVNVPRYFAFVESFLSALSGAGAAQIVMRAYPTKPPRTMQAWDFQYRLREQLARVKRVDGSEIGARKLMRDAKLVIVDYFSTSFIECMLADVPTVFLWNRNTRYTLDAHADYFAQLIDAGICQVDPVAAAAFVDRIKDDPAAWWGRPEVRRAREAFLSTNIGEPRILIEQLLDLARAKPVRKAEASGSFS